VDAEGRADRLRPQAANPIDALQLRWFDRWLKGIQNGADHDPKVRIFVMGANRWRSAETWPLPGTKYRKLYFHSGGKANSVHGDGWLSADKPEDVGDDEAATDAFTYDPTDPVPSIGGRFQASVPGGRTISGRSSAGPTCWSTRPRR